MKFEKHVVFLRMVPNCLRDGSIYYTISLFDQDSGPVQVNVTESHNEVIEPLLHCTFGVPIDVTFELRPKDRLFRLTLASVEI